MRIALAVFLLAGLSGCLNAPQEPADPAGVDPGKIAIPDGASAEVGETGVTLRWDAVEVPFETTFQLPEHATMVRFVADPGDSTVGVAMWNTETGRRRCNQQTVEDYSTPLFGARSCSSIAAIDRPGTNWTARAYGSGEVDIRIEFLDTPIDGPAAGLDLAQLSQLDYETTQTKLFQVPSFDGELLWVEVTLPEGPGPWPTIVAASPYNGQNGRIDGNGGGTPAMWTYWTQDYAMRGYAAVNVDVRGFGNSGGCVEIWGENEQRDQAFIVDWVADQAWSNGNVGFYGQSYVGTTPVAAASRTPEALKAIIAVAPVINAYEDWHYGGVPNGESTGSPQAYQIGTDPKPYVDQQDPQRTVQNNAKGLCDPTIIAEANDPRAVYDAFYEERDFKKQVANIKAAVLYTQGFEDANVKSAMIPGWFNEIRAPKLGVFGHWTHQHPARMDAEVMFLGWMDQYVKGKPVGMTSYPAAVISVDAETHRQDVGWPPLVALPAPFYLQADGTLGPTSDGSQHALELNPYGAAAPASTMRFATTMDEPLPMMGNLGFSVVGDLNTGGNGFLYARLDELREDGSLHLITWGRLNLAHNADNTEYTPLTPGAQVSRTMPLRPTEHIIPAGATVTLTLQGVTLGSGANYVQGTPGTFTFSPQTHLALETLPLDRYDPIPLTALP